MARYSPFEIRRDRNDKRKPVPEQTHAFVLARCRDTLDGLKTKKSEYERGDTTSASLIKYNNPVGDIYRTHYKSICEAIRILEQNRTIPHVEQQITDILRDLDF